MRQDASSHVSGGKKGALSGRSLLGLVLACAALLAMQAPGSAAAGGGAGRIALVQGFVGIGIPSGLATARPDGSDQRLIGEECVEATRRACPNNPAWSPDGRALAFDLRGRLALVQGDGDNLRVLQTPGVAAARPAWSPDGKRLVFEGTRAGRRNLYLIGVDGTGRRQLTFRGGAQPDWSSDNRIAFVRRRNIHLMRPNGTALRRLASSSGVQPDWSPDARQLAIVRHHNLYRLRVGGGGLKRLTRNGGREPAWQPDGKRILFDRGSAGYNAIFSIGLAGGPPKLVTRGQEGRISHVSDPDEQPLARASREARIATGNPAHGPAARAAIRYPRP